ncbi:MAG: RNA-directed DNA polymerase [Clostridiales bacterium]|nr:RNA-directed DNA polymerase [Clostridiales bacterium]
MFSVCDSYKVASPYEGGADFFSSIYLHNIETCLREVTSYSNQKEHADVLIKMIKGMNVSQTHKGLPIGPQFSRPIAELIMNEVDKILIQNDVKFIRYVDDIRIFCKSEAEAYRQLSLLAQKYYDLRNLKLNESKTRILTRVRSFSESQKH